MIGTGIPHPSGLGLSAQLLSLLGGVLKEHAIQLLNQVGVACLLPSFGHTCEVEERCYLADLDRLWASHAVLACTVQGLKSLQVLQVVLLEYRPAFERRGCDPRRLLPLLKSLQRGAPLKAPGEVLDQPFPCSASAFRR